MCIDSERVFQISLVSPEEIDFMKQIIKRSRKYKSELKIELDSKEPRKAKLKD